MQQYLFAGPISVVQNSSAIKYLLQLHMAWVEISLKKSKNSNDEYLCDYFSNFICQYCDILIKKIKIINENSNIIDNAFNYTKPVNYLEVYHYLGYTSKQPYLSFN